MSTTSTTHATTAATTGIAPAGRAVDRAQYGLAAFLAVVGAYVVYDATTLADGFADQPVQPYAVPVRRRAPCLVVLGVLLAVATARGDRPEAEDGRGRRPRRRRRLAHRRPAGRRLRGQHRCSIDLLGWAITGAVLFAGSAWVLGSRHAGARPGDRHSPCRSARWYGFYVGLGIPHPRRHPGRGALMEPRPPPRRLRSTALDPHEPDVRRARRAARHRRRRAARHRPGDDASRCCCPVTYGIEPRQRDHHVRRHLLRRDVRRLDDLDPAQHPRRVVVGDHRASRATRWPRPAGLAGPRDRRRSAPSWPARSAPSCWCSSPRRSPTSSSSSAPRPTSRSCCSPSSRSPRCSAPRKLRGFIALFLGLAIGLVGDRRRGRPASPSAGRCWPTASTSSSWRSRSSRSGRRSGSPRTCDASRWRSSRSASRG